MCSGLQREAGSVQRINKVAKVYIDKVYRVNTWVQNHLKDDKIYITKQYQINNLKEMESEYSRAANDLDRQVNNYYNAL